MLLAVMLFSLSGCGGQKEEKKIMNDAKTAEPKLFDAESIQGISEKNRVDMDELIRSVNTYEKENELDYKAGERETCHAVSYKMSLQLQQETKKIAGTVQITLENHTKNDLYEICIRNYAGSILKKQGKGESEIFQYKVNGRREGLALKKKKKDPSVLYLRSENVLLPAGGSADVYLEFDTSIPKKKERFGYIVYDKKEFYQLSFCFPCASVYEDGKWNENPYISSDSESNYAKCADYDVTVQVPDGFTVMASGRENVEGQTVQIKGSQMRELAMVVSNGLKKKTGSVKGITVNCYGLDYDKNEAYHSLMLQAAMDSVELFTDLIGVYPYKEYDVVLSFIEGGMEYPGMVMVGLPDMDPKEYKNLDRAAPYDLERCSCVAHETAHQWFYGAVGNDPYRQPWLDESFAEYCENMLYLQSGKKSVAHCVNKNDQKDTDTKGRFSKKEFDEWMEIVLDQIVIEKPVDGRLDSYDISENEYSKAVYDNGSYFLYELQKTMGSNKFFHALRTYYKAYSLKEATKEDFFGVIRKADGSPKVENVIKKYTAG